MNDRKRLFIWLPILAVAAWLAFFGDKKPAGEDGAAVAPVAAPRQATGQVTAQGGSPDMLAVPPAVASAPLTGREAVKAALQQSAPVNLFPSIAPPAPPAPPARPADEDAPPPPPAFRAIGSMVRAGRLNVFLDKDNQTYVAIPGAVIDGHRVDLVKSDEVHLFNLSTKSKVIIPIEGDK